ncbi:MAG: hypothetical protein DI539_18370 [Flavobacterium psychrophilum]|nr:MAG: hypothetical protein DI539_18370 [Flavobacterium psychrophilum]
MKKLLQLALAFSAIPICATAQVSVTTQYTAEQLVNEILLSGSCYTASNITSKTGTDFSSVNGIGYFQANNSDFPFESGIILSSGDALNAAGPNTGTISTGSQEWPGDTDINTFLYDGSTTYTSKNASALEFDFVPQTNQISLDYIFASNEYGQFQCNWGDGVVILLKDLTDGTDYMNMATIPGTTVPVSIKTIRSNLYNSSCTSINQTFFGNYYPVSAPTSAPINFRGDTVAMTASASVISGHTYHIKIVIADMNDAIYDSAVFINAGSLNVGPFENFYLLAQGDNICSSEGLTLTTNLGTGFSYQWSLNGITLVGEAQSSLSPTIAGEYSVTATHGLTGCTQTKSISVEAGEGLPIALYLSDLIVSDENNDGFATFDLTLQTADILSQTGETDDYTVYYYETAEDAEYGTNPIANPTAYTNIISSQQTLYASVIKTATGCYEEFSFNLIVGNIPEAPTGASEQTFNEGQTLADIEVEGENIQWYDNSGEGPVFPDGTSEPLPLTTVLVDGETYYASQTINGVESTQRLAVTVNLILNNEDFIFNGLRYYPNPANNILNIENTTEINSVSIVNTLGQKVIAKTVNSNAVQVDVTSLSKGIYFVTVNSGNAGKTVKIIKE